nr:immunoglobulin heavy chain junction region [Mus musculus]NSM07448.1 immunoglobulin heavy chain junction region [Mus musculus]
CARGGNYPSFAYW